MEINEFNQEKLRLLDTEQLLAFYGIFGRVSSPKAEAMVKGITRELKRRNYTLGEENLNEVDVKSLMKGLVKGTTVAGKGLAKAIKVGYPIAKDMVKATWMTSKKIGGAIGDLMDDPEFRKLFTKYVDNPNDKNRTKKIQAYADGMLSDAPISGFESVEVKESRLKKVCSLVLGKDFDQDFIYEDVDFTKPSAIKDGYKSFALKETVNENRAIVHNPKGIKRFIKQAEKKFPQYKGEIEQLEDDEIVFPDDEKLKKFFKGAKEVKFVLKDSVDLEEAKIPSSNIAKFSNPKAAKQAASKQKYKTQIFMGDDDKFWVPSTNKEAGQLKKAGYEVYESTDLKEETFDMFFDGYNSDWHYLKQDAKKMRAKLTNVETQFGDEYRFTMDTTKSNLKKLLKKYGDLELDESTKIEEAVKFWTVTITKKAGKLFKGQTVDVKASNSAEAIKKGLKQMKADPNTVPSGSVDAVLGESIEESNKDKYMWGDINKALSSAGLNPRIIMNVLSKLKGKALKESRTVDLEKANVLTYDEYDEVQNFKNFNKKDWKRNAIQKKYIRKNKV